MPMKYDVPIKILLESIIIHFFEVSCSMYTTRLKLCGRVSNFSRYLIDYKYGNILSKRSTQLVL